MHIGIAGLGRMGAAIAGRLMECGNTVTVWNRSAAKVFPLAAAGAFIAESPAEVAGRAETIITILTDAAAIDAVYLGPSGLLSADIAGKLFIEMSTVRPEHEVALAAKMREKGAYFVECPVSGTIGPARQGKLIGLVGADGPDAERAKPILDQLCRRIEHCGPVGAGALVKLAINLPLMIYWQALGESLALCRPLGLDPARLIDLLADTGGGTNVLKTRGPAITKIIKGEDAGPVTFDLDGGRKDLRAMLSQGEALGIDLPLVETTLRCFEEATRHGLGGGEGAELSRYWANRTTR
ncbi:MAG: NAD(P)-dependent oxidoreductase [Bradyrhizobium sp.]